MRLLGSIVYAGALLAAVPALAQDQNSAAPNQASTATNTNAVAASAPADQNLTAVSPNVSPALQNGANAPTAQHAGFPWGVLGLLGLIGLFGVRKAKG